MSVKKKESPENRQTGVIRPSQPHVENAATMRHAHPAAVIASATFKDGLPSARDVLRLQRTMGNRITGRILAGIIQRHTTHGARKAESLPGDTSAHTGQTRDSHSAESSSNGLKKEVSPQPANHQFDNAPIQRLIGFEVEAHHLPATEPSTEPVKKVINLLDGMPTSGKFPEQQGTWKRVFDTNSALAGALLKERKAWRQSATKNKKEITSAPFAMIPEYVTVPFDERADEAYITPSECNPCGSGNQVYGVEEMQETMGEIAKEIADVRKKPKQLGGVQVGVPLIEDWVEAANYFGIEDAEEFAMQSRENLMAVVSNDKNYVQATVGILPERLPSFLHLAAKQERFNQSEMNMPVSAQDPLFYETKPYLLLGLTMDRVDKEVHDLVYKDLTQKSALQASNDEESQEAPILIKEEGGSDGLLATDEEDEKAALDGVLRLVLHVTAANMLWYTSLKIGGIGKNMISYFPKTPLHMMIDALPYRVNPSRMSTTIFADDFNSVVNKVYNTHLAVGQTVKGYLKTLEELTDQQIQGTADGSNLGAANVKEYLVQVLSGASDPFHAAFANETLSPEKPSRGGREGVATHDWFWRDQKTRAVVVEMRHAIVTIPADKLVDFADTIRDLVRRAHGDIGLSI